MKKNSKQWLTVLFLGFLMAFACACSDEDEPKQQQPSQPENTDLQFCGTITMDDGFTLDSICSVVCFNEEGTLDLTVKQVKFSPNMPLSLDMTFKNLSYTITEDNVAHFAADTIVPWAMGGYMSSFTCYNLKGNLTNNSQISYSFDCNGMTAVYTGTLKQ